MTEVETGWKILFFHWDGLSTQVLQNSMWAWHGLFGNKTDYLRVENLQTSVNCCQQIGDKITSCDAGLLCGSLSLEIELLFVFISFCSHISADRIHFPHMHASIFSCSASMCHIPAVITLGPVTPSLQTFTPCSPKGEACRCTTAPLKYHISPFHRLPPTPNPSTGCCWGCTNTSWAQRAPPHPHPPLGSTKAAFTSMFWWPSEGNVVVGASQKCSSVSAGRLVCLEPGSWCSRSKTQHLRFLCPHLKPLKLFRLLVFFPPAERCNHVSRNDAAHSPSRPLWPIVNLEPRFHPIVTEV